MFSILLVIIYLAFISLGLPDSVLGSAWPSMYKGLNVPVSYAGIISMIISAGTIISSMNSAKVISKLGTGLVTAISVMMTAVALLGFSFSSSFYMLCLWGIPYGLGAGSVDAALNNFVALHYKSRHMSWLHCFWGLGATIGPYIMGLCLTKNLTWNKGYQILGIMQVVLAAVLFTTLFLWKEKETDGENGDVKTKSLKITEIFAIPGAKNILFAFFCYCSVESISGLWAGSYMVLYKHIDAQTAAKWVSLFYLGITGGRFISGFIADKLGDKNMVRLGQGIGVLGILILFIPSGTFTVLIGLLLIGFGCAPIYPSLIHATPHHFGAENSQALIGMQMACAYVGTTLMPPIFGVLGTKISLGLFPVFLIVIMLLMIVLVEGLNRGLKKSNE